MSDSNADKTPKRSKRLLSLVDRGTPLYNLIQAAAALIFIGGAMIGLVKCSNSTTLESGAKTSTAGAVPTTPAVLGNGASTQQSNPDPTPECWNSGRKVVSCNLDHQYQVVGLASECNPESVFYKLGGEVGVDVLSVSADKSLQPGACVVDAGQARSGSFLDALRGPNSTQWRQCLSGQVDVAESQRFVSCDQPHQGELTSSPTSAESSVEDCRAAIGRYMGRSQTHLDAALTPRAITPAEPGVGKARCEVWIYSGRPLVDSMRRLGNAHLPRS